MPFGKIQVGENVTVLTPVDVATIPVVRVFSILVLGASWFGLQLYIAI